MVDFQKIYRKYCRSKHNVTTALELESLIKSLGFSSVEVKEHTCHSFVNIDGFMTKIEVCSGFFPKVTAKELHKNSSLAQIREVLGKADFVVPPFMRNDFVWEFTSAISTSTEPETTSLSFSRRMYSVGDIASIFTEYYKNSAIIGKYYEQLLETLKAFHLGLYRVAITSLIPPMEGVIRDIGIQLGVNCQDDVGKDKLIEILEKLEKRVISHNVFQQAWVPSDFKEIKLHDQFNEQIQMIESLKYETVRSFV